VFGHGSSLISSTTILTTHELRIKTINEDGVHVHGKPNYPDSAEGEKLQIFDPQRSTANVFADTRNADALQGACNRKQSEAQDEGAI
jgi:hypothetical protein